MNVKDFITYPINFIGLSEKQYIQEETPKKQIVLHHTASGKGVSGDIASWETTEARIATCVIIAYDGTIYQTFSSKYWGYHLGVSSKTFSNYKVPYTPLDKYSLGIEIDSWGPLTEKDGKFYSYTNKEIPKEDVYTYDTPFRGYKHYEKYTDDQIEATLQLIRFWSKKFNIPLKFNIEDAYHVSINALQGNKGIYTHCSYRDDKTDIHPQQNLVSLLQNLKE